MVHIKQSIYYFLVKNSTSLMVSHLLKPQKATKVITEPV